VLNIYLFLAFSALWVIFFLYAWSLSRRQARLRKELEELKSSLEGGRRVWKPDARTVEKSSQSPRTT
jgi:CcmD family protein